MYVCVCFVCVCVCARPRPSYLPAGHAHAHYLLINLLAQTNTPLLLPLPASQMDAAIVYPVLNALRHLNPTYSTVSITDDDSSWASLRAVTASLVDSVVVVTSEDVIGMEAAIRSDATLPRDAPAAPCNDGRSAAADAGATTASACMFCGTVCSSPSWNVRDYVVCTCSSYCTLTRHAFPSSKSIRTQCHACLHG